MRNLGSAFVTILLVASLGLAQSIDPAKFAAAQKQNSAALRMYAWKQRTELKLKGESKNVTLNLMRYDAAGQQQKTPLNEPAAQPPAQSSGGRGGRLKAKVVEKKTDEFKDMLEGLAALVKSYTHIPPDNLKAAMAQAQMTPGQGQMQGAVSILLKNVLANGDQLTIWADTRTLLFRQIQINCLYDGKPVTVVATYQSLPSGESYMGKATVQYPGKGVEVQIDNFEYQHQ